MESDNPAERADEHSAVLEHSMCKVDGRNPVQKARTAIKSLDEFEELNKLFRESVRQSLGW